MVKDYVYDIPLECKFRSSRAGLSSLMAAHSGMDTSYGYFSDAILFNEITTWVSYRLGKLPSKYPTQQALITTSILRSWASQNSTLFIRIKGYKHWIIMEVL